MIKLMPGYVEDVAAWQARLEDLAAKGWFYVPSWILFRFDSFERGRPKTVRYRLEPAAKKEGCPDWERRETYRALGWEYVDTIGKTMHLWRCDDPEAPELHTDPETEARAYDRFSRQERISRYLSWGILALFAGLLAFALYVSGGTYFAYLVGSWQPLWYLAAGVSFFGTSFFMARWQTRVLRRTLRTMRAGVEAPRRRPYRLACGLALVMDLLWVFYVIALGYNGVHSSRRTFRPISYYLTYYDESVPYVEVSQDGEVVASPQENWLTSEQWWTIEDYTEGRRYYRYSEALYYRLRFPSLADDLADSLLAQYGDDYAVTETEYPGLDGVWTGAAVDGDQYMLLRLGDQVWSVEADTDAPQADLLPQYAAAMAEARQG